MGLIEIAKRIYLQTVIKWLLGIGGTLIGGYFGYLAFLGLITINSYSGDMVCAGTNEDPCIADISFCVNKVYGKVNDIFIYPTNYDPWGRNTTFEFNPAVKDWKLQRKWGTNYRTYDLTKPCRSSWCGYGSKSPYSKFSLAFREGKCYEVRILGYKYDLSDTIKWGAFDEIDPLWIGTPTNETPVNETPEYNETHEWIYEPENKTWIIVPKPEFRGGGEEPIDEPIETDFLPTSNEYGEIKYSQGTEDTPNPDGSRTLVLYSGVRNVYEDGGWKKVENVKSLNNSSIKCVVESDDIHLAECLDFNYTHRKIKLSLDDKEIIADKSNVPIKVIRKEYNETLEIEIEVSSSLKDFTIEKTKEEWIKADFGDIIEFGEKSTLIVLQDANTENLEDTYSRTGDTSQNGDATTMRIGNFGEIFEDYHSWIKFNLSKVPSGQQIDNALLCIRSTAALILGDVSVYEVSNQTWDENTCMSTDDNCPINGSKIDTFTFISNDWNIWNTTSWVSSEYSTEHDYVSFKLSDDVIVFADWMAFATKEWGDAFLRPSLNITYSEEVEPDTTPPTVTLIAPANNSAWDIDNTPDFNYSATDDTAVTNCSLFINNTFNASNDGTSNFTSTNIGNGNYHWFVNCSDAIPNWGYSGFHNLTVSYFDIFPPSFSAITDNSSATLYNGTDVQINNTIEDVTGINYYTYSHNDTDGFTWTNETLINANGATSVKYIVNHSIKWFPTTGGTLGVRFWANDTGGYSAESNIHTITVQAIVVDSCSCPVSGDWNVNCGDLCNIVTDCNLDSNNLNLDGTGNFTLEAEITNIKNITGQDGCNLQKKTGANFTIIQN